MTAPVADAKKGGVRTAGRSATPAGKRARLIRLTKVGALSVLAALFPLILLAVVATSLSQGVVRDEVASRLRLTTDLSGSFVGEYFGSVITAVEARASTVGLVEAVGDGGPDDFDSAGIDTALAALQVSRPDLKGVALLDLQGILRASSKSPQLIGQDFSTRAYFVGLRDTGRSFVSGAFVGSAAVDPTVVSIATYVRATSPDGRTLGDPLAALVVSISLDNVQAVVDELATAQAVQLWITDQNGVIVAQPGGLRPSGLELMADRQIGALESAPSGQPAAIELDGEQSLVVRETAGPPGWSLYAVVNRDQAYAGADSIRIAVYAIGIPLAIVVCLGIALLLLMHRRQWDAEAELSAARDEARSANQRKSEFLANVSHELRTPLNSILGFGRLLELDDLSVEHRANVGYIVRSGEHLLGLIDEVLDISRVERGEMRLSMEPVSAQEAVAEAIGMCRPLADRRGIQIIDDTTAVDSYVHADRQRLQQVLVNLLANAVKYNREGGEIRVHVTPERSGSYRLLVSDTGWGMSESDLERLFQPFERLSAEGSPVEGTGLGLALTKKLMTAMSGQIGVQSRIGEGSTFWIELPTAERPLDGVPTVTTVVLSEPVDPGHPITLLYIEDNLSNVRLVEQVIRRRPQVTLIVAMQGRIGLQMALEHRPEMILLDLHLPDISGEEVLSELRADGRTAQTPVVVLSADVTVGRARNYTGPGATTFLSKPFDISRMLALIDHLGVIPDAPLSEMPDSAGSGTVPDPDPAVVLDGRRNGAPDGASDGASDRDGGGDAVGDDNDDPIEVFAHEMINLLGVVLAYCDLLVDDDADSLVASYLEQTSVAATRAVELTRVLLTDYRVVEPTG